MVAIVLVLLCCLTAPAEVAVDKDTLVLGDLIEFPSGDARASLPLGYAPNPGLARRLHDYEILGKLRVAGLPTDDLKLPDSVLVRRASRSLDTARVHEIITGLFVQRFPDARIEILELTVPKIEVATGTLDLSATLPATFNPDGPISVRLEIQGEGFSRSAFVRTRVRVETPQPVLVRPVEAHSPIVSGDVQWQLTPLGRSGDVVGSINSIRGKLSKQDLREGQILTERLLYSPVMVRRGDSVTVRARLGSVTVAATMIARSSGEYGDTIVVEHLNGGGKATARVTGDGTVEVIVGGQL